MSTPLDTQVGGSTANSYAGRDEADQYFADDPNRAQAWGGCPPAQRDRALLLATRWMERLALRGAPLTEDQALHFPTAETVDRRGAAYIPIGLKYAQIEWAFHILARAPETTLDRASLRAQGVRSFSRPGLSEQLTPGPGTLPLPPEVRAYLQPWLIAGRRIYR